MKRLITLALAGLLSLALALPALGQTSNMNVGGLAAAVGGTLTKSTKTTAYSSGQIIAQSATAGSCSAIAISAARNPDFTGIVWRVRLKVNDSTFASASVRVHLFKDNPTFSNGDAANFSGGLSESNYLGYADVVLDQTFSSTTVKGIGAAAVGNGFLFEPSSGTTNIYAVLEARSTTAGSHTASSTWSLTLEVIRN